MSGKKRGTWEKIVSRWRNPVRPHRRFRPAVEELAARIAPAVTLTWNGAGSDWGTAANWDDGNGGHAVPGVQDNVILKGGRPNDPTITGNVVIGSLVTDTTWVSGDTLTVNGSLTLQGDAAAGNGDASSEWDAGTLALSTSQNGTAYLELTSGHYIHFDGGKITSTSTLGSVYVDRSSSRTGFGSWIYFESGFSDITANVFIGKAPGGVESHTGGVDFSSDLNAGVYLHGASTITVNDHGTLNIYNSALGSLGGIRFAAGETGVTAHIDMLENGWVTLTAPNAQPMPLPSITQENGTLEINGKVTINVGSGQEGTPGLQLSGGALQLDPGSYVTADLTATGSGIWRNPSPSSGTATTVLNGAVNWSSEGYISVGDMGNALGHFTNWVQLQCNQFTMTSGTLNIGVGGGGGGGGGGVGIGVGGGGGDTVLVQGNISLNNTEGSPDNAALAVYAYGPPGPPCNGSNNAQPYLNSSHQMP